jgi:hypothetical protein
MLQKNCLILYSQSCIQRVLKGTRKCARYIQVIFVNGENETALYRQYTEVPFIDSDLLYRGVLYR